MTTQIDTQDAPARRKAISCPRNNLKIAESVFAQWFLGVPRGVTREQLLEPDFHAIVADQYHAYDRITCLAEDRSFVAELMVVTSGRGWAQVIELSYHALPVLLQLGEGLPAGYEINYHGVDSQYCATRLCDGVRIVSGASSRAECLAQLLDHSTLKG